MSNLQQPNGRVNILQPDPNIQFSFHDKIACDMLVSSHIIVI